MRRKSKAGVEEVCGFRHRDYVSYTYRNGETHAGYVTAMYPEIHALNFQAPTKHCKKANALKCRLIWRFDKIYWFNSSCSSMFVYILEGVIKNEISVSALQGDLRREGMGTPFHTVQFDDSSSLRQ